MNKAVLLTAASAMLIGAAAAHAGSATTFLDAANQDSGNQGFSYVPTNEFGDAAGFTLSARTGIDQNDAYNLFASGDAGTLAFAAYGLGVQDGSGSGSDRINGGGNPADEEVIFDFDNHVLGGSLVLGLARYNPGEGLNDGGDANIFLSVAGSSDVIVLDESDYAGAYTSTGAETGFIDFGLLNLGVNIDALTFRATRSQMSLSFIQFAAVPIPAPLALGLVGLAGVGIARRRRMS